MPLIFAEPLKYNFSIDTLTSVIKPNLLYVILILIPAVIGAVATLFYFIRGNNKIVWKVLFIIMTTSEIIITYKFENNFIINIIFNIFIFFSKNIFNFIRY